MGVGTDNAVLGEALDQGMLKGVGHQVPALRNFALLKRIAKLRRHGVLAAQLVPESLVVGVGRAADLVVQLRSGGGLLSQRGAGGHGHLAVQRLQALKAVDLVAQRGDLVFHVGVGGVILSGEESVSVAVGVKESLSRIPGLGALVAQFSDSHTDHPPVSFSKEKAVPSAHRWSGHGER